MPTKAHLAAAEQLKCDGNALFARGKYGAAVERYTEAITLVGQHMPVLYVNRAMAHRRREAWDHVLEDATTVLRLDGKNMKANYLAGLVLLQRLEYESAIRHLNRALEAAREANDSIKDDIWRELAKAKYAQWQQDRDRRRRMLEDLKGQLSPSQQAQGSWGWVLDAVEKHDKPTEVPSVFTCPLTMETFRDPAITKFGQSYERSTLLEHLKQHKWDPITRQPLTETEIAPNLALRQAVQHYLDEHPWAWKECF